MDHTKLRQYKVGQLRWFAAASRPDIRARLARIASRINALRGSDAYLIKKLTRVAKAWQQATVLKYASPSHPWKILGRGDRARQDLRNRGEKVHSGSRPLVGLSDAASGGHSTEGRCRLGCAIGLTSSTLRGPCHILQRTSKCNRNLVKSSPGGEVCTLSEKLDHMLWAL